jgi:hypothetical protein
MLVGQYYKHFVLYIEIYLGEPWDKGVLYVFEE